MAHLMIVISTHAGETIPASDSDDDDRMQEGSLEGAGRERSMWVMQRLAREAGTGRDVVAMLAKLFGASEGLPAFAIASHPQMWQCSRFRPYLTGCWQTGRNGKYEQVLSPLQCIGGA